MNTLATRIAAYAHATAEVLTETVWTTRCAICEAPGAVLCERCRAHLSYIDYWKACPRCGSPFGRIQCCDCNDTSLMLVGRQTPGYDRCASAVSFDAAAARIVRIWKDGGERRLARDIAAIMSFYVPPAWRTQLASMVYIPASQAARRRRGFDHARELATELAAILTLPVRDALDAPRTRDQRKLGRHERMANTQKSFTVKPQMPLGSSVLLIDDVHTTGATLFAAADALHEAGVTQVWTLTFARVW